MAQTPMPAVVPAPGRIIERELNERGWAQKDLAAIMKRPPQAVNEIIRGAKQITPETALELAQAFGTSAELWMNLEANYRLHLAKQHQIDAEIARRSQLYSLAPVPEMIKRGWVDDISALGRLENQVWAFLGISSSLETPRLTANLRRATTHDPALNAQVAWLKRVESLTRKQRVGSFSRTGLRKAIPDLLSLATSPEDLAKLPPLLLGQGVRFFIVPQISRTYIDGAAWLSDQGPTIGLTLRYDRIDAFWFTLLHEVAHLVLGHSAVNVDNLFDEQRDVDSIEQDANALAQKWLVDEDALQLFVKRTKPYFARSKVEQFAASQDRHPGIIVGRLHHDGLLDYQNLNAFLVKVSTYLKEWTDTPPLQVESSSDRRLCWSELFCTTAVGRYPRTTSRLYRK